MKHLTRKPFHFADIIMWRSVDPPTTRLIATLSSKGADLRGLSKKEVYRFMERPTGCEADAVKFAKLMRVAAEELPKLKANLQKEMEDRVNRAAAQYHTEQGNPPK